MGDFEKYGTELDTLAKTAISRYNAAEVTLREAKVEAEKYPKRNGMVPLEYMQRYVNSQQKLNDAKTNHKAARNFMIETERRMQNLRGELSAAIDEHYSIDPKKIDTAVLSLLNSDAPLTKHDYKRIMEDAVDRNDNATVRVLTAHLKRKSADLDRKDPAFAKELRLIAHDGQMHSGEEVLNVFDSIADVFKKTTVNPRLGQHWEEITAEAIKTTF